MGIDPVPFLNGPTGRNGLEEPSAAVGADQELAWELMVRSLLAIGALPGEIAKLIKRADSMRAA